MHTDDKHMYLNKYWIILFFMYMIKKSMMTIQNF